MANAAVSCVAYLGQLFVPVGLSPYYSHPEAGRPAWQVAGAVAVLLAITAAAVLGRRAYPYVFVGWFWYVGMLVPVLGLVFVGGHSRADRYTYLSQIGLYVALVWGAMRLGAAWPARRWVFGIGSALVLVALMACSWRQTGYWQDDKTLWEHASACDPNSATAYYTLGTALDEAGDRGAPAQYRQALELDSDDRNIYREIRAQAHSRLGRLASRKGDIAEAIAHYEQALAMDPNFGTEHLSLGMLLAKNGDFDEAMLHFQRSIEMSPGHRAVVYCNMAHILAQQGKTDEAIANYHKTLAIDPNSFDAHMHLATLLAQRDDVDQAITHFRRLIEIDPDVALPYYQTAQLLRKQGKTNEAFDYDERGRKASCRYAESRNLRGAELAQQGDLDEAIAQFQIAIAVFPDYAVAHANLADALALHGNIDGAIQHYRRAIADRSGICVGTAASREVGEAIGRRAADADLSAKAIGSGMNTDRPFLGRRRSQEPADRRMLAKQTLEDLTMPIPRHLLRFVWRGCSPGKETAD